VARIEELLSRVEEVKRLRKQAKEEAEQIMQAALRKVFSRAEEEGWEWKRLEDVLTRKPQYGLTARSSKAKKEFRYIRISDISDDGTLKEDDSRFLDLSKNEFEKYKLEENDVLIARSGTVGRIYLHEISSQKSVFASYLIRFKLDPNKVIPKFFFYYGLSPLYRKFIEKTLRTVAQPNINAKKYCQLKIPIPPVGEQKKIVAYLDKIREIAKSLKELQQKTEEEIEKLAPAILDKAFKGQL
jgi:type I restriction enzyme S subunit